MALSYIPAGSFQMGKESGSSNEKPVHTVILDAFWMDQSEVTNAMYTLCVVDGECNPPNSTGSSSRSSYYGKAANAHYPVIWVDWYQAAAYCAWAGRELPTEAQWEYAARGGLAQATYPWGNESPSCMPGAQNGAQYLDCSPGDTIAVASFAPNGYGLHDLAGNILEWVADWYGPYSSETVDNPAGPAIGSNRVLRGGDWGNDEYFLQVPLRLSLKPHSLSAFIGFRCSLSP
jgi:formylglycine-generating enzyme required for sulfatase activity